MSQHRYQYEARIDDDNHAAAFVARLVGQDKRVLELGSGPGSITRLLHGPGRCRVTALEREEQSAQLVAPYCERVLRLDLDDPAWVVQLDSQAGHNAFDVAVAADVLEHLHDPLQTLRHMTRMLRPGGYVVVSLPNAGHNGVIAALASGRVRYGDTGLLDRTHIRFFGLHDMQALFDAAQLCIEAVHFVGLPPTLTELADLWAQAPARLRRALAANPYGGIYQVVIQARAATSGASALRLDALVVPSPRGTARQQLRALLRQGLGAVVPARWRSALRKTLRRQKTP